MINPYESIYRIFTRSEFFEFNKFKRFKGNQLDLNSGFIHLSAKDQVQGTIEKYFNTEKEVFVVEFLISDLENSLKWGKSRDSEKFPHYYGVLEFKLVKKVFKQEFRL